MKITKNEQEQINKIGEQYHLKLALIYGSFAKGKNHKDSDLDIAVLGKKLLDFKEFSFDELVKDWLKWNALEHIFMKIIGRGIDINEHLIAELAGPRIKAPRDYRETFLGLWEISG